MDHQHNVKGVGLKQEALNVNEKKKEPPCQLGSSKADQDQLGLN